MWFTEDAVTPIIFLAIIGIAMFAGWTSTRNRRFLIGGGLTLLLALVVAAAERAIETDREKAESTLMELIDTFIEESRVVTQDKTPSVIRCHSFFAADNRQDRGRVTAALMMVEIHTDMRITDVQVTLTNSDTRAITHFRANGTVRVAGTEHHRPTRWELTWQKEGDEWRVTQTRMLHVVKGDEIAIPRVDR